MTGTHAVKTGMQWGTGGNRHQRSMQNGVDLIQEYRNKAPVSVNVYNTSQWSAERIKYDLGIYLQDSWTLNRLTLNPGDPVRAVQHLHPERSVAGRPVRADARVRADLQPAELERLSRRGIGGVYDVSGDGKTAMKAHAGKYMRAFSTVGFAQVYNPLRQETDRRTWTDRNGDDIAQDSEIGPVVTPFNTTGALNRVPDPDILRPYQWEYSLGIQRELVSGVSVSFNWVRRDFSRLFWTDNVLTTFDDYTR